MAYLGYDIFRPNRDSLDDIHQHTRDDTPQQQTLLPIIVCDQFPTRTNHCVHLLLQDLVDSSCCPLDQVPMILVCQLYPAIERRRAPDVRCASYSRAPNGPDYRFGGPNRSKLRSYRWFTVRPTPEPVQTIINRFGLLVQTLLT